MPPETKACAITTKSIKTEFNNEWFKAFSKLIWFILLLVFVFLGYWFFSDKISFEDIKNWFVWICLTLWYTALTILATIFLKLINK